jgi:DNA-binding MarR family transcriptional regulator
MSSVTTKELDAIETALVALYRASFQHRAWEDIQLRAGLSLDKSSAALLKVVKNSGPSHCRIQDIADVLGIEAPSVSRTVQELERDGLVTRQQDDTDRRASQVRLTEAGVRQLAKLQSAKRARLNAALHDWSNNDRQALARLLHQLAEAFTTSTETKQTKS